LEVNLNDLKIKRNDILHYTTVLRLSLSDNLLLFCFFYIFVFHRGFLVF